MNKFLQLITVVLLYNSLYGQSTDWVIPIKGQGVDLVSDVAIDAVGNIYAVGIFHDAVNFNPNSTVEILNQLTPEKGNIFCAKYNPFGVLLWVRHVGGTNTPPGDAFVETVLPKIVLDDNNDIFITGKYLTTIDFDTDPNNTFFIPESERSAHFLCKLDTNGNFNWVKPIGQFPTPNSAFNTVLTAMDIDSNGNMYLTGYFQGSLDFDPSANASILSTEVNHTDFYILKLDSSGNFVWVGKIGNDGEHERSFDLSVDSNAFYITGFYRGSVDFDIKSSTKMLQSNNNTEDIFVAKYDLNGDIKWARTFGSANGSDTGRSIDAFNGDVYITGDYRNAVDFDPDPNATATIGGLGPVRIFLLKLDTNGDYEWVRSFGATNLSGTSGTLERPYDVLVNSNGLYLTGNYIVRFDCNPDENEVFEILANDGNFEIFLLSLDHDGVFNWGKTFPSDESDNPFSIAVNQDDLILAGLYRDTISFDELLLEELSTAKDGFIAKLNNIILGTEENLMNQDYITVQPNPTKDIVNISSTIGIDLIQVYDLNGGLIYEVAPNTLDTIVNLKRLTKGVYLFRIHTESTIVTKKIIVK